MNEMLTISDLMQELKVGRTTAYRIAKRIGVVRVAHGAIRIERDAFDRYKREQREADVPDDDDKRKRALAEAKQLATAALRKIEEAAS